MHSGNFDYDIIIIGAGISGLAAAHAIREKDSNISFLVLEGNERIGGRVHSTLLNAGKDRILPFDTGGQFICERQIHLVQLLRKLNIPIQENINDYGFTLGDFSEEQFYKTDSMPPIFGDNIPAQDVIEFLAKLERMSSKVSLENPLNITDYNVLDSTTMEAYMYDNLHHSLARSYIRAFIKNTCGAEASDISVLFFLVYCNSTEGVANSYLRTNYGAKGRWMQNAAPEICEKIAADIGITNIKTNSAVMSVQRNENCVSVRTAELEYKCQYVIMALAPDQMLKVYFYPPLTDTKITIYKRMYSRVCVKYVITYREEFWRKLNYNGDIYCYRIPKENFPIIATYNISADGVVALTGYLDIEYHDRKESHRKEVLAQLMLYFGSEALEPLDYTEKKWSYDDNMFESSAICFPPPRTMKIFHEIRRPLGRMFFAGAETATYWYGHIGGAAQAGLRAAIEVLYEIRPQCLTGQDFIDLKPRRTQLQFYNTQEDSTTHDWIIILFITTIVSYLVLKIVAVFQYILRLLSLRRM